MGYPFVGDSGRLLENLWHDAYSRAGSFPPKNSPPKIGITNIVACVPLTSEEYSSGELRIPTKDEVDACRPRFLEILELANPQVIVLLGDTAKRFFPKMHNHPFRNKLQRWNGKLLCLIHPAAILRQDSIPHAELMSKRFVLSLVDALKELS